MGDSLAASRPRIAQGRTLARYLFRELSWPTVFTLIAFAAVVLMKDAFVYAELILVRGADGLDVARMAALNLVPALTATIPLATLVGMLIGLGRLAADRELSVLESTGQSPFQRAMPCFTFAVVVTLIALAMSTVLAPASERARQDRLVRLARSAPTLGLRSGIAARLADWRIEAGRIDADGRHLSQVRLQTPGLGDTIFANRGKIILERDARSRIQLEDGVILQNDETRGSMIRFDSLETLLPTVEPDRALPFDALAARPFRELQRTSTDETDFGAARKAKIEMHRRLAHATSTAPLGLVAVGLSLAWRRASRSKAIASGLVAAVAYYALVQMSEGMLRDEGTPIGLAIWMPNGLVSLAAASILARSEGPEFGMRLASWPARRIRSQSTSRRWPLSRYVGGRFLASFVACAVGLTLAYVIFDVTDNLKWFNKYDASVSEIGRFYAARAPVLAARVIPLSLLIGCSLTISALSSNGELLGMRACGLSVFRCMTPVWILCLVAVPLDYLVSNELVPRNNARASEINRTEIKNGSNPGNRFGRVWRRSGGQRLELRTLDLLERRAQDITIYDLDHAGLPLRRVDAKTARRVGGDRWLLQSTARIDVDANRISRSSSKERIVDLLGLSGDRSTEIETSEMTPREMRDVIARLDRAGGDSLPFRTDLQHRLAAPLACILLPFLVLCFSSTGPPYPRPALALLACLVIAVAHAIVSGIFVSLGHGGSLTPSVAAWAPSVVFTGLGAAMALRMRWGVHG